MVSKLFIKTYQPDTLEQAILLPRVRKILSGNKLDQHILLSGHHGMGKTSMAYILSEKYATKYINISDSNGIDTVRETIKDWCGTTSLLSSGEHPEKVTILDEVDGCTDAFARALRAVIDQYHTARFIATCNDLNRVPGPITSRFLLVDFNPQNSEEEKQLKILQIKRIAQILKENNINIEKTLLIEFVKMKFPDMRSMLNIIQEWSKQEKSNICIEDIKNLAYSYKDLFELVCQKPNPEKTYREITSQYSSLVSDILMSMGRELPKYILEKHPNHIDKLPYIFVLVAEEQYRVNFGMDPLMNLLSCVNKIQLVLHNGYKPNV